MVPRAPGRSRARPGRVVPDRRHAPVGRVRRPGDPGPGPRVEVWRSGRDGRSPGAEGAAGGGVRRDHPRRADPAQPAGRAPDQQGAVDAARRRPRARRGPARRGRPRGARGDRASTSQIGETAHVYSFHQRNTWRQGRRADAHSLRIVYDGWVPVDAPEPHVVEVDGSTDGRRLEAAARTSSTARCRRSRLVTEVLEKHRAFRLQRVAAYALVVRGDAGAAGRATRRAARYPGGWTLPGGGIDHGESPQQARGPRGRRGDRAGLQVGRGPHRDRLALRGHGAVRAHRGLPHRADRLRGAPSTRRPAPAGRRGGRHLGRRGLGRAGRSATTLRLRPNVRAALAAKERRG